MATINFYDPKEPFGEFSNYYPSPIIVNNFSYPTVEHFFHTQKFLGQDMTPRSQQYAGLIASQSTPNKAKILARQEIGGGYKWRTDLNDVIRSYPDVQIRADWDLVKDEVMRSGVYHKFLQNPQLWAVLNSTGDYALAEHTSRDSYWGDGGNGTGLNKLGQILVGVRTLLRQRT